jgi:signal transduction histidine kinase
LQQREKELLQRISSSAVRLDGLIQDILKYSRVAREPIDLHPINVEDLVRGIMQDYPGLQPPNADIEVQTPLGEVKANEAFLTQCISNLLSNAVKFVKPGGQAKVRVWSEQLDHQVRLWFEDNGIGIAPYARRRIFGIFQRLHPAKEYGGTGIGLAVVKKAAERMGGKVGLESTPGKGSKFWLELPRA